MNELPIRKRIRLKDWDYSQGGYYFITICTKDKRKMLGEIVGGASLLAPHVSLSKYGIFVNAQIGKINKIYPLVSIDHYIVMPNHIHMIAIVNNEFYENKNGGTRGGASPTKAVIPQIVQSLKSMTTKQFGFSVWQRSYHDHIIRDEADYLRIWQYIDDNPDKWEEDCYYD